MKKLNNVSVLVIVSCILLSYAIADSHEILSKAVFLFIGVWIGILNPLIVLLFFKKTPRVDGIVTDLSQGRSWVGTIVSVEFEYEGVKYTIIQNDNSEDTPAIGTRVTVMVDCKEIENSIFEEKDSFYSSGN